MNTATLVTSLVMAAVLVVLIAVVIQAMMRGWRRRAERQAQIVGSLPALPATVGPAIVSPTKGIYVGSTLVPHWNDRVAAADLGFRAKAVLTRYPEGIMVQRSGAAPIWIPDESIADIRTDLGLAGKVIPGGSDAGRTARPKGSGTAHPHDGVLAIRWRLPTGIEIDTGFCADDRGDYSKWLPEEEVA